MNATYILIPLLALLTAFTGSRYTNGGMKWYEHIRKPNWTPSGKIIGTVWAVLFIFTATSAMIAWESTTGIDKYFIAGLYVTNALLSILWTYIFFREHQIGIAVFETGVLLFSVAAIIIAIWSASYIAALLLLPYLVWVSFAMLLTHRVWKLNTNWKWSSI